jgi:hypothetical protein
MKPDDLDQILLRDQQIAPTDTFTTNVMARIENEAAAELPIPFFQLRLVLLLALLIPAVLLFPTHAFVRTMTAFSYNLSNWILSSPDLALRQEILTSTSSLLGTWFLIWVSLRLTGSSR